MVLLQAVGGSIRRLPPGKEARRITSGWCSSAVCGAAPQAGSNSTVRTVSPWLACLALASAHRTALWASSTVSGG